MKKLSVITPLYNTPKNYLDDVLQSVSPYADSVELVLVNDSPNNRWLARRLEQIKKPHITIVRNEANMGIFRSYCNGFLQAHGEYCCILDHDDIFDPKLVLEAIDQKPDLIYTDEYKFYDGENGERVRTETFVKPKLDVLSTVFYFYTHHVTVLKTKIVQERLQAYQGNEVYTSIYDIHMTLEYLSAFIGKDMEIVHIPEAVYGWRIHPNSTAFRLDQKLTSYYERVKKADEFLKRFGETPLLNIDKNVGYLVEGEFLSTRDMVEFPMKFSAFQETLSRDRQFRGKELVLALTDDEFDAADYEHFFRMLPRLPMRYLQAQNCLPLLIPEPSVAVRMDVESMGRHVPNVPALSKVEGPYAGLLIYASGEEKPSSAKYAVLIRK